MKLAVSSLLLALAAQGTQADRLLKSGSDTTDKPSKPGKSCSADLEGVFWYQSPRSGRDWQAIVTCLDDGNCYYQESAITGCASIGAIPASGITEVDKTCQFGFDSLIEISPAYDSDEKATEAGCDVGVPKYVRGKQLSDGVWSFEFSVTGGDEWYYSGLFDGYLAHKNCCK